MTKDISYLLSSAWQQKCHYLILRPRDSNIGPSIYETNADQNLTNWSNAVAKGTKKKFKRTDGWQSMVDKKRSLSPQKISLRKT